MCTVTLVAAAGRLRAMCNRDERHDRPEAHPPAIRRAGSGLALLPIDPQGGGTWVAVNTSGLMFATLNRAGEVLGSPATTWLDGAVPSRGQIILELVACDSLPQVVERARALSSRAWPPHRLIAADSERVLQIVCGPHGPSIRAYDATTPVLFTSSSLGDELAETARRPLFEAMVHHAGDRLAAQDRFHRHRWRDRPHLSVDMRRHDAATRSITTVEITPGHVAMRYESVVERTGACAWLALDRRAPAAPAESCAWREARSA